MFFCFILPMLSICTKPKVKGKCAITREDDMPDVKKPMLLIYIGENTLSVPISIVSECLRC